MVFINQIPNKSLFKSQEVCDICEVKPYVLRFWDSEFDQIDSIVNSSGKKLYQKRDIIVVSVLRELLFDRKLTIEKARHELSQVCFDSMINSRSEISDQVQESSNILNNFDRQGSVNSLEVADSGNHFSLHARQAVEDSREKLNFILSKIDELKSAYNWV